MTEERLARAYDPAAVEPRVYKAWEEAGVFFAHPNSKAKPFAVMMPPPNITGSLHIGHALNMTLQDVLTRFHRMQGCDSLWQPGSDHAGIATQMVVERQLTEEGGPRREEMGREAFVERVWQWRGESGGTINRQLRRLGASPDWTRERFTLDEGLSRAVRRTFVRLHRDGLIYRDKRLVNWDVELRTAVSDLEVVQKETKGTFWHIRYPLVSGEGHLTVATTRPETMLGDTCVAVHPDDNRYKNIVGSMVELPLTGRTIPVVADTHADPEKGSGAVKITPAHDFDDFEVGRRHGQELINILEADGTLNANVPEPYRGLDRFEARQRIVADLEAQGLLERTEETLHTIPFGDRSGTVIEPWLTDQWFVNATSLAGPAIEAVEKGKTRFVPETWTHTYFEWMRNIQPWCISRQLWWGHRIPAWHASDGKIFVAETETEAIEAAEKHYGKPVELFQDEDVLDTWFSSGLWPFSTLGWPDKTSELKRYYPGTVLVTGFDIIFFWVARMMMLGIHLMGEVPFRDVYIHALVRDAKGRKMSKSEGNVIDPLELMDRYGTDAVRFTLVAMAAQGRDIRLSEDRVGGYRNFVTKIWNAARFLDLQGAGSTASAKAGPPAHPLNRWIENVAGKTANEVAKALKDYRFDHAAFLAYGFTWRTFCDWYLEIAKPLLQGENENVKKEIRTSASRVFSVLLRILHPMMPFVTEELWKLREESKNLLASEPWPEKRGQRDDKACAEIEWLIAFVSEVRSVRAELRVPQAAKLSVAFTTMTETAEACLGRYREAISRLARIDSFAEKVTTGSGVAEISVQGAVAVIPFGDVIDVDAERIRLAKDTESLETEIDRLGKKLTNPQFVERAPENIVEEQRARFEKVRAQRDRIKHALRNLTA